MDYGNMTFGEAVKVNLKMAGVTLVIAPIVYVGAFAMFKCTTIVFDAVNRIMGSKKKKLNKEI